MKKGLLLVMAFVMAMSTLVMATEPSKIVIKLNDKSYYRHVVAKGDTLYSISKAYGVSQKDIMRWNSLQSESLTLDAAIYLPVDRCNFKHEEDRKPVSSGHADHEDGKDFHVVRPGETIYSLSRTFGISEEELMAMNNLATTSDLKAGMKIRVRKDEARATDKQQKEDRAERPKDAERHDAENYSNVEQPLDETLFGEYAAWDGVMADVPFVAVPASRELNVALLMPFHDAKGTPKGSFVDFYRGVLLAMEDLKAKGYTINLKVIDTKNSAERIYSYSAIGELDVDLIIGPAYRSEFLPLLRFAERKNIPVVSPLTNIDVSSPVLFNMPPADEFRGEPIKHLLDGSHTLVTIYASSNDYDYVKDVYKEAAGASNISLNFTFNRESFFYQRNADGSNGPSVDIESIMRDKAKKVFVVAASSDVDVDRILGTLSSTKMSVKGRGLTCCDYKVIGNRDWLKTKAIDVKKFYGNDVIFVSNYASCRNEEVVRLFDGRYINAFGDLPSKSSNRGYDAAMIFCELMFTGFEGFADKEFTPLVTTYKFMNNGKSYVNVHWMREHYRSNSSVDIE